MSHTSITLAAVICAASIITASAQVHRPSPRDGTEFLFGSEGAGQGKFKRIRDLSVDAQDNIHVLDGIEYDARTKTATGNGLVQVFDEKGKFLREFPVGDASLGDEKNTPARMAMDGRGNYFITMPALGEVWMYGADGKPAKRVAVPDAYAITSCERAGNEMIAVMGHRKRGRNVEGCDEVVFINPATGDIADRLKLAAPVPACVDIKVDSKANLFALAQDTQQCFKFSRTGERLVVLGHGAVRGGGSDGSVFSHALALDAKDNLYTITDGGRLSKFNAELTSMLLRQGGLAWNKPWVGHGNFVPLAVDSKDRVWLAANSMERAPDERRPAIVRVSADFYNKTVPLSAFTLGLKVDVASDLPYDISHEPGKPVNIAFTVAPSNRRVDGITVEWQVVDTFKNEVAKGRFDMPLKDMEEGKHAFLFTPPRYGWYAVLCKITRDGVELRNEVRNIGVTPRFPNMPDVAEGGFVGGWDDLPRQVFAGLTSHRTPAANTPAGLERLEKVVALAEQHPEMNLYAQFTRKEDATPENVRAVVEKFKGRVKAWEILNEPNLNTKVADYVEILRAAAAVIREVDPAAKIIGPDTCGINLDWNRTFMELGGGELIDIYSVHDYEGNETCDPPHWRWKYGELKKLMEEFNIAHKPVWQTERGWVGVRQRSFMPHGQAIRLLLHRDLLETLGIPNENNNYYYLNNGGYGGYPAYLWSANGPHAAVMGARMRHAMVKDKKYAGELDFGPTGNTLFMGLRFEGADEDVFVVRNLGMADTPAQFKIPAAATVLDWAGNPVGAPGSRPADGILTLPLSQLPHYIRAPKGAALAPVPVDFGENIAPQAVFTFNGFGPVTVVTTNRNEQITTTIHTNTPSLNNGLIETTHAGNPLRSAFFYENVLEFPQSIEITFPAPREAAKMIVHGVRPDNPWCGLLEFDVQCLDPAGNWVTLKNVKHELPASEMGSMPHSVSYSWVDDANIFAVVFDAPVTAARFRLLIHRVTYGLLADDPVSLDRWNNDFTKRIALREIEIYGK